MEVQEENKIEEEDKNENKIIVSEEPNNDLIDNNDKQNNAEEVKLDSVNENDEQNQTNQKGNRLRAKKKIINVPDKMGENNQIEELREENEEITKNVPEKVEEKHSKCGCFIF